MSTAAEQRVRVETRINYHVPGLGYTHRTMDMPAGCTVGDMVKSFLQLQEKPIPPIRVMINNRDVSIHEMLVNKMVYTLREQPSHWVNRGTLLPDDIHDVTVMIDRLKDMGLEHEAEYLESRVLLRIVVAKDTSERWLEQLYRWISEKLRFEMALGHSVHHHRRSRYEHCNLYVYLGERCVRGVSIQETIDKRKTSDPWPMKWSLLGRPANDADKCDCATCKKCGHLV